MDLGHRLKHARTEKGLTQEELAKQLGVSRQTVFNWENGRSAPDVENLVKLGSIYDISMDSLLKGEEIIRHFENVAQKRRKFWQMMLELGIITELAGRLLTGLEFFRTGQILGWTGLGLLTVAIVMHLYVFDHSRKEVIRGLVGIAGHWTILLWVLLLPDTANRILVSALNVSVFLLICSAGVWTLDVKSTRLWLIIALLAGTPLLTLATGLRSGGHLVENTPFPGDYRVEAVLYPQETDRYCRSRVSLGSNNLTLYMDGVYQDYIGIFTYCEPNLEDKAKGIWLLTPQENEDVLYRLTLEADDSLQLACWENEILQWHWKLEKDHRKANISIATFGHTTMKELTWYPEDSNAPDPEPSFRNSIDVVMKGKLTVNVSGLEEVVLYEEYHHGDDIDYETYVLKPDRNGRTSLSLSVRYKEVKEQYAICRIPFEDGEYRFTITFEELL